MSYAIGSLVSARGREWVVQPDSDDELLVLRPVGGSSAEETGVLLSLEGQDVSEATFPLPGDDDLGDYRSSQLLRDALRLGFRSSAGPFRSFGRIAVEPRPYQLVPLLMAMRLDPVRLLIADDVGIGKTIEALLIAREMLDTGQVQRMSVLCSPQLAEQWQREMREKFHLDAALVLPSTVRRLERGHLGARESLFERYPITIVSTDYIKQDRRRDEFLRAAPELIIVDEAHTCVAADGRGGSGKQLRATLVRGLAADADRHMVLCTATPHSGKGDAFRALIALLDRSLEDLPEELAGSEHEDDRTRLARHFVQRKRADIKAYLGEETSFPTREATEHAYRLRNDYAQLFNRCLDLARDAVVEEADGKHRQRVRWWSVLALLRSVASSPRAAASTLRNRAQAADTTTVAEADRVGRETVLDLDLDESSDDVDVPAGADTGEEDGALSRRQLLELARLAESLEGTEKDAKLDDAITMAKELIEAGHNPIFFCRFIHTADYLGEYLRDALPKGVAVGVVTGSLPSDEREARVEDLGKHEGQRILVATDCMSEGINLQQHFDAVVHYDLSWNPTRHEQREGRVDRYGQNVDTVRVVSYWGEDNQIDGLVLDVLLRKHAEIRKATGVSVPIPGESEAVVEAIIKGVVAKGARVSGQLVIEEVVEAEARELLDEWRDVAEQEKRSQTKYAQRGIRVEEVAEQLRAVRQAVGSHEHVEQFLTSAGRALGATIDTSTTPARFDFTEVPEPLRAALGPDRAKFVGRFEGTNRDDEELLLRTHPVVETIAEHTIDTAIDGQRDAIARRAAVIRTDAVQLRTTVLLVRFRFNLVEHSSDGERPLLAEDARILAFRGAPSRAEWLPEDEAEAAFKARPSGNVNPGQAEQMLSTVLDGFGDVRSHIEQEAQHLADELLDQHRSVRTAAKRKGVRFSVEPHLPPDVLGLYVLLPGGAA